MSRVAALAWRVGAVAVLALVGAVVLLVSPVSGQSAAAPEITSAGVFTVAEGTTSAAALTAADTDTAPQRFDLVQGGRRGRRRLHGERVGRCGSRLGQGL